MSALGRDFKRIGLVFGGQFKRTGVQKPMNPRKPKTGHRALEPSHWVVAHGPRVRARGSVLDVAAGRGRHSRWFLDRGHAVTAVDIDLSGLSDQADNPLLEAAEADLENGSWPFGGRSFDGIVVTNYLWRPLFPLIQEALSPGGVLIYETFGIGNEEFGKPSNPAFLLHEGELLEAFSSLDVIAYEHGFVDMPKPAIVQRFCAVKPA